jgi:hypothetical protein
VSEPRGRDAVPSGRDVAHDLLEDIAPPFLSRPGVDWGPMFGSTGLRVRGKVFAVATHSGALMVKVPQARAAQLRDTGTVSPVVMAGRTMREWVSMPVAAGAQAWCALVEEAYSYLDSITPG